jgi:tetratricopeptide (TPR) repeat protein
MRIGQVLLEAELISAKQLSDGLEYGNAKNIFLGKAMTLLKYVGEEDVDEALKAQKLIALGLSPVLAIKALKRSVKERISLEKALQDEHLDNVSVSAALKRTVQLPAAVLKVEKEESTESLVDSGDKLLIQDCCDEALAQYQKALTTLGKSLGAEHIDLAPVLVRLGNSHMARKSFDEARQCYEKVLSIRTKALGEEDPQIAHSLVNLADLCEAEGEPVRATEFFLRALDILEKKLPQQLGSYAAVLRKLTRTASTQEPGRERRLPVGEILKAAGLLTDRELQTALRMSKQTSMPLGIVLRENCMISDRELQSALKAQFCMSQGVLSEQLAIDLLTRAARRNISLERLLHEASVLVSDEEKFDLYRQIASELDHLVAAESSAVNTHQDLAPIAYKLGALYEQVGDQSQSEIYYSRALSIWGSTIRGDVTVASTCMSLAKIYQAQSRQEEAVPLLLKALEHRQHALGASHEETIETVEAVSEAELEQKNAESAARFARQAISYREKLGQEGAVLLRPVVLLGDALLQLKEYAGAQAAYSRAMVLARSGEQQPTATLAAVMEKLGDLYEQQKMVKAATPLYKGASLLLEAAAEKDTLTFERLQSKISKLETMPASER